MNKNNERILQISLFIFRRQTKVLWWHQWVNVWLNYPFKAHYATTLTHRARHFSTVYRCYTFFVCKVTTFCTKIQSLYIWVSWCTFASLAESTGIHTHTFTHLGSIRPAWVSQVQECSPLQSLNHYLTPLKKRLGFWNSRAFNPSYNQRDWCFFWLVENHMSFLPFLFDNSPVLCVSENLPYLSSWIWWVRPRS